MFKRKIYDVAEAKLAALDRALAIIEFSMDGQVLTANENFLRLMRYTLGDIQGWHHRLFVEETYAQSAEYGAFWETLKAGRYATGEFLRLDKDGSAV